jgi:rSAM/selenodomain-associated transferase 1
VSAAGVAGKNGTLVVFAKDPQPGQVKTRMCPTLSPQRAADFYCEMLADVLEDSVRACEQLGLIGVVAVSPSEACASFAKRVPRGFSIVAQQGPDLGARMGFEVSRALATGSKRVVLRGSDNPALGCEEIASVYEALATVDLAVSPDLDGGYGAIGLRVSAHGVFDHIMSTASVLSETLARATSLGLSTSTTQGSFDLDCVEDLCTLASERARLPEGRCRQTLAFADAHNLWPTNVGTP